MEKQERQLSLEGEGREVLVPTGPYEIKTVEAFFRATRDQSFPANSR
jgi:hypothetical protein